MRRFILLTVLTVIALAMVGCGVKELTDDTYPEVFIKTAPLEDEAEIASVLAEYATTPEEYEIYSEELYRDTERLEAVSAAITKENIFAGMVFDIVISWSFAWDNIDEELDDWSEDWDDDELSEALRELSEALEAAMDE